MLNPSMRRRISIPLAVMGLHAAQPAKISSVEPAGAAGLSELILPAKVAQFGRWGHIVQRLSEAGVSFELLQQVFTDKRMPEFEGLKFSMVRREPENRYGHFLKSRSVKSCLRFVEKNRTSLEGAEKDFGVDHRVITAILRIESAFGSNTGKSLVVYRIARLASAAEPANVEERARKYQGQYTHEQVLARARELEEMFLPQLVSLFKIYPGGSSETFSLRGSSAGAMGAPQFLPLSYELYAIDGNGDGVKSLFDLNDAIPSIANYLQAKGWRGDLSREEKLAVLMSYNNSMPYCETVMRLSELIDQIAEAGQTRR